MKKFLMVLIIALALALAAFSCKESDPPKPHESTITAFGKTIKVRGDASISTADFNTAKGKLQEVMELLDENLPPSIRTKCINMLDRTGFAILIKTGSASPDADANKSMTIGVDYLLSKNVATIENDIGTEINYGAFAD